MAGFDDEIGGSDIAPGCFGVTGAGNGRKGHTRALRKGRLRLIQGGQILVKSHAGQYPHNRGSVKPKTGGAVGVPVFGYTVPVGNVTLDIEERREALRLLMDERELTKAEVARQTDITTTTLDRVIEGPDVPKADKFQKLNALAGYAEKLAGVQNRRLQQVSAGSHEDVARLVGLVGEQGLRAIVYAAEGMARIVGPEKVVQNIEKRLADLQDFRAQSIDPQGKSRKVV